MNVFRLRISSPDGNKFDGELVKLDVRGCEGDLAVMAGHTDFVTVLEDAPCTLWFDPENARKAHSKGGILTVSDGEAILISGSFCFLDESRA